MGLYIEENDWTFVFTEELDQVCFKSSIVVFRLFLLA